MIETTATVELRTAEYLAGLNAAAPGGYSFDTEQGRTYNKVVMTARGGQRSVHSFIGADGAVYKAAGWQRPAKHVRFRLADDASFEQLMAAVATAHSFAGAYLYIR